MIDKVQDIVEFSAHLLGFVPEIIGVGQMHRLIDVIGHAEEGAEQPHLLATDAFLDGLLHRGEANVLARRESGTVGLALDEAVIGRGEIGCYPAALFVGIVLSRTATFVFTHKFVG